MSKYIIHKGQKYVRCDETPKIIMHKGQKYVRCDLDGRYVKIIEMELKRLPANLKKGTEHHIRDILEGMKDQDIYAVKEEIRSMLETIKYNAEDDNDEKAYKKFKIKAEDAMRNI